ncbi:ABUW_2363 family tetratricopeptide repeat lipoprotein [Acinetobacter parvus]|uniref:ABUW_2363 family tetratricopeptide repeat lipoprotein n=1 Tax=Acinetobacter parvus TaxID=134533 RepID=UPI0039195F9B
MNFKPLALLVLSTSVLTACGTPPVVKKEVAAAPQPFVFKEPDPTPPFYALNPVNYDAPPSFELAIKDATAQPVTKMVVSLQNDPSKSTTLEVNKLIVPTVNSKQRSMRYGVLAGDNEVDVTEIDDFLQLVEGKARHYPPRFTERQERKGYEAKLREITQKLDALAENPNASLDVLTRAFKASVMARNMDLGTAYTTKSLNYAQRILAISPNDPETNFWFGFGLSEGGGQREAIPYLDKAIKGGVQEAYLSAANNFLWLEQKKNAIQTLKNYKVKYPDEAEVADRLISEVESGKRWNVWQVLN